MASPVVTELIGIGVMLPGFGYLFLTRVDKAIRKRANAVEDINFQPEDAQGDVGYPIIRFPPEHFMHSGGKPLIINGMF
jgi:hypothetical protein